MEPDERGRTKKPIHIVGALWSEVSSGSGIISGWRSFMSQVWLITGASRGLGRALTEAALAAGHRVLATARNPEHLVGIAKKFGRNVMMVSIDVTDAICDTTDSVLVV